VSAGGCRAKRDMDRAHPRSQAPAESIEALAIAGALDPCAGPYGPAAAGSVHANHVHQTSVRLRCSVAPCEPVSSVPSANEER